MLWFRFSCFLLQRVLSSSASTMKPFGERSCAKRYVLQKQHEDKKQRNKNKKGRTKLAFEDLFLSFKFKNQIKIVMESFGDDNLYSFGALDGKKPIRYTISLDNYSHNMKRFYGFQTYPAGMNLYIIAWEATMETVALERFRSPRPPSQSNLQ